MNHPYNSGGAPQKESAATLAGHAATFGTTQRPEDNAAWCDHATQAAAIRRSFAARLDKLGLSFCTGEDDALLICGRFYDVRGAALLVRQLERASQ